VTVDDYVMLKMDIEGAEYAVIQHLLSSAGPSGSPSICLVDELFVEIHFNRLQRSRKGRQQRPNTWADVRALSETAAVYHHLWF
jgi:hypothetical protein